jgi:hypothetical protein
VLGFSVDAVRQRIRRGQLERAEPEDPADNRVYVWLNLDKQSLDLNRTLSLMHSYLRCAAALRTSEYSLRRTGRHTLRPGVCSWPPSRGYRHS